MYVHVILAILLAIYSPDFAVAEISTLNSSVRALGMGDAFTAVANDGNALFYNPAGLARVRGLNWKIFSVRAGASNLKAYEKIKDLKGGDQDEYAEALADLYGDHVWSGAGGESIFTAPMIGFGVYDHADALIKVDNPVYPEIYTSVINDYGYVLGLGAPFTPFFHAGFNLRYVKRTGARLPFGASFVADLDADDIYSHVSGWGKGYGADFGVNFVVPAPMFEATLSAAWKNIGRMSFRSNNTAQEIPYEDNDITLGAALMFDTPILSVTPAVDVRYLNNEDLQLTRKLNFGVEVSLPLLDIRGGFREGYWTYGFGVNLGLFRADAASYGVELGDYPGQIEDRRYVVEFTMELGVGGFTAPGLEDSKSGKGGGASGSQGSGRRSSLGSGRLKQRR